MRNRITNLFNYIKNCNFYCKDGYHHLPYLGDSPQRMLEGLKNLPFVYTDEENGIISANTPWIDNKVRYIELEEGLWLIIHDSYFKANICGKAIYEQKECNYYSLFYNINKSKVNSQNMKFRNIEVRSNNCTLHRPKGEIVAYIPKGTHAIVVNFLFDKNWLERNINYRALSNDNSLKMFFEMQQESLICNDFDCKVDSLMDDIFKILNDRSKPLHPFKVKNKANELLMTIMSHLSGLNKKSSSVDYKLINVIEIELAKTLKSHFPGLHVFAKACNCSVSKIKYVAEEYYGKGGISSVHQKKRMELARQMIEKNSDKYIKEIAHELGYENACKFSDAYKKHFGFSPAMTTE